MRSSAGFTVERSPKCGSWAKDQFDTLLIFMLKGRRPEKFRDNASVNVSGNLGFDGLVKSIADKRNKPSP